MLAGMHGRNGLRGMQIIGSGQHHQVHLRVRQGLFKMSKRFDAEALSNLFSGLGASTDHPVQVQSGVVEAISGV